VDRLFFKTMAVNSGAVNVFWLASGEKAAQKGGLAELANRNLSLAQETAGLGLGLRGLGELRGKRGLSLEIFKGAVQGAAPAFRISGNTWRRPLLGNWAFKKYSNIHLLDMLK
jgi:hypothetical protein